MYIALNNYGAVIRKFFYSILFHMDFNTELFRRPTKCILFTIYVTFPGNEMLERTDFTII